MSQLSLGNMYAKGSYGVPANPQIASAYLGQANQSIALLSATDTPQSRQILKSLPMEPQRMQREIERIMRDLSKGPK
jgi:cytochrome c551/c552